MLIKCKMCGGDLRPVENATTCECEYCGSIQTIPKLDNERRLNLYERANHYRRNNEYDKAMSIFEQILQDDRTDAEAYWSLVLCRYGIEYVEDPTTKKRIPTVNRAQFTSIFADEDYKSALKYADAIQKGIYEEEAKTIDDIQKGILDISKKEKSFDVFICYKETDADGRRTPDSVLANDLYYQLTREGFKVFFSRITLEDKLGQQYEPYIFAALNSAKVMVVLGTKPEYFNAVWVRNEWSRYLKLIRGGANKTLVPAYKDMDPYDLPEEFSHLQAQDMSKLGFMQDLIHGIRKLAGEEKPAPEQQPVAGQKATGAGGSNAAALLDRAFMALEDGEWVKADDFCEKVLNIDARNARAYIGKLMIELKVRKESDLQNQSEPIEKFGNYIKAMRFADESLQATLKGYNESIKASIEQKSLQERFNKAMQALNRAQTAADVQAVKSQLTAISGYKETAKGLKACTDKLEDINNRAYNKAKEQMVQQQYMQAALAFRTLGKYRDSQDMAEKCTQLEAQRQAEKAAEQAEQVKREAERKAREEAERIEKERAAAQRKAREEAERKEKERAAAELKRQQEEIARREAEAKAARAKKARAIVFASVLICIAAFYVVNKAVLPKLNYNKAVKAMQTGQYNTAITAFTKLGDYKDCNYRIQQAQANKAFAAGQYDNVLNIYASLPKEYQDHAGDFMTMYNEAKARMDAGDYDTAIASFTELGNYSDSQTQISEATYRKAGSLKDAGDREKAEVLYSSLNGYKDSGTVIVQMHADMQFEAGSYADAWAVYVTLPEGYQTHNGDYADMYIAAVTQMDNGNYDDAAAAFASLGTYSDAATQIIECTYRKAGSLAASGSYDDAIALYNGLNGFSDSVNLARQANADKLYAAGSYADAWAVYATLDDAYQTHNSDYADMYSAAVTQMDNGNYDDAAAAFVSLGTYSDAATQIIECTYRKAGSLAASGSYDDAIALYNGLNGFSDSVNLARQAKADKLYAAGSYADAWAVYATLDDAYQTHADGYASLYADALVLQHAGQYDESVIAFKALGGYSDAANQIKQSKYLKASSLAESGNYDDAITLWDSLGDYSDSSFLSDKAKADNFYDVGNYADAYAIYATLGDAYQTHAADYAAMYDVAEVARTSGDYENAYEQFIALGTYADSQDKAVQCGIDKADELLAAGKYDEAVKVCTMIGDTNKVRLITYKYAGHLAALGEYKLAADQYFTILDYEDSQEQHYQMGLQARVNGSLADACSILAEDPDYRDAREALYQTGVTASAEKLYEVSVPCFTQVGAYKDAAMRLSMDTYAWGGQLYDSADYDRSAEVFDSMGEFSDAPARANDARYAAAGAAMMSGAYDDAADRYAALGSFSDSVDKVRAARYAAASEQLEAGNYADAKDRFIALDDYSDSQTKTQECDYRPAMVLFNAGNYTEARDAFAALGSYADSIDMARQCDYIPAKALYDAGQYQDALNAFITGELSGYKDSDTVMDDCRYQTGKAEMANGAYESAAAWFDAAGDYSDSKKQAKECRYQMALAMKNEGQYDDAVRVFRTIISYNDSRAQITACYNAKAVFLAEHGNYEEAYTLYEQAGNTDGMLEAAYQNAIGKLSRSDYEGAIVWFEKAGTYSDAREQILSIGEYYYITQQYDAAEAVYVKLLDTGNAVQRLYELGQYYELVGNNEHAARCYREAGDYQDAPEKAVILQNEADYQAAESLFLAEDWEGAKLLYAKILGYKDASTKIAEAAIAPYKKVGNYVNLGHYEQDNNTENGKEAIEWIVVDVKDNKALLVSRYNLDAQTYNTTKTDVTWESCSLRTWLNGIFMDTAFTANEQKVISLTTVDNSASQGYSKYKTDGGNNTKDKIFLLSYEETWKYFTSDKARKCTNTEYVASKSGMYSAGSADTWWLRSPGSSYSAAAVVDYGGDRDDRSINRTTVAVRPALWLDLDLIYAENKEKFTESHDIDKNSREITNVSTTYEIGSYVTFGHYEQDNNAANGKESIEWLVLDYDGGTNQALLISRYALDCQRYNTEYTDVTWEKCTLRSWLNNEFIHVAFSAKEQSAIPTVTVKADKNPDYNTDPGRDTQDKVFLLSISDVKQYFKSNEVRMCAPTDYAISQGASIGQDYLMDGRASCSWWLQSPGYNSSNVSFVLNVGSVFSHGYNVNLSNNAVRPALYVDLNLIP